MERIKREKIYLKKINQEVVLDFFTIEIDQYLDDTYGAEKIHQALMNYDDEVILNIFWLLLNDQSKRVIADVKVVEWRDMKEHEVTFTNPVEKLKRIISGTDELIMIWTAIIETHSKSMAGTEDVKKKVMKASQYLYGKSSSSSQESTDSTKNSSDS